jgi:hypothetical protein
MATYYYADVRRYLSTDSTASVSALTQQPLIKQDNITTNTQWYVYYVVDVYSTSVASFDTWRATSPLPGSLVSTNGSGGPDGFAMTIDVTSNSTDANVVQGKSSNDNSHWKTSFSRKGGTTNGQVVATPTVAIQWKSTASPNWTSIPNINWRTSSNLPPTLTWSTVQKDPVFPADAVAAAPINAPIATRYNGAVDVKVKEYTWDQCIKKWAIVVHKNSKNLDTLWYCDINGSNATQAFTGPSSDDLSTKAKISAWSTKNYNKFRESKQSGSGCGDQGSQQNVATPTPTEDSRWNPPPHRDSRSNSFFEKLQTREYQNDKFNTPLTAFKDFTRGYIYQDANGAATLNKNPDKLKDLAAVKTAQRLWGFKFMYNPTTFSYSTASNNAVDWTLGQSDPATLLAGNSNVTFEVYINRIPDLKYLRLTSPKVPESTIYKRPLTQVERDGILNRGTEYDIEFLYRVLNGDPLQKSLLLNYNGVTADFGYTTGVPCWLVLNENMRYFGTVASFQVSHVMFDLNMVPMLSTVSVTFSRYPALWNDTGAFGTGASANSIHNYLANNGKAPGK